MSWSKKRWLLSASLLLATLAVAQPAPTQSAFDRAIELAQQGQPREAAAALVQLADDHPDDAFADDALSEAALLYEQSLGQPERAVQLLARLIEAYPQSRLVRRAEGRLARLRLGLASGEAPFRDYQAAMAELPRLPAHRQLESLRALLVKYPDFSLRDELTMQVAAAAARAGQFELAMTELAGLEQRAQAPLAARARLAHAELLLALGRIDEAAQLQSSDGFAKQIAQARLRRTLFRIALGTLGVLFLAALVWLGRSELARLWREPPIESLFFLPVGVIFVLAGLTENRLIRWATLALAAGGWIEVTLFAGLARRPARRRRWQLAGLGFGLLVAVVALFLVVVESLGLTGLVTETLRHGPER